MTTGVILMAESKCPTCGSEEFYARDPDDEYEVYEFCLDNGRPSFSSDALDAGPPEIEADTEVYCNRCAWHGKLRAL